MEGLGVSILSTPSIVTPLISSLLLSSEVEEEESCFEGTNIAPSVPAALSASSAAFCLISLLICASALAPVDRITCSRIAGSDGCTTSKSSVTLAWSLLNCVSVTMDRLKYRWNVHSSFGGSSCWSR